MSNYTQKQREYWHSRPARLDYNAVVFRHPDFGDVRLVANMQKPKQLSFEGVTQEFQPVSMKFPAATAQTTDATEKADISFGRIGQEFRETLDSITPAGEMQPIECYLLHYQGENEEPDYQRRLYVSNNGITIGLESVTVKLSADNPAKIAKSGLYYDPLQFKGLLAL